MKKTLKKSLSLVLALLLVVSLMGVAANAFTDNTKIRYPVEVGVLTGMGIINGYPDGSFQPLNNVTRAEAAKMVCYALLGVDATEKLPNNASSFTDMSGHWANKYVQYLASQGIVDGRGDGTFDPNGNVTAFELAKMLLAGLGYGKQGEFVGKDWALNVATLAIGDANSGKILSGNVNPDKVDYSKAATRDEAALYIFNAFFAPNYLVQFIDAQKVYVPVAVTPGSPPGLTSLTLGAQAFNLDTSIGRVIDNGATANDLSGITLVRSDGTNVKLKGYDSGLELINHAVKVWYNTSNTDVYYVQDLATVTTSTAVTSDLLASATKNGLGASDWPVNYSLNFVTPNLPALTTGLPKTLTPTPGNLAGQPVSFINNNGYCADIVEQQTQILAQVSYILGTGDNAVCYFTDPSIPGVPVANVVSNAPVVVGAVLLIQEAVGLNPVADDGMYAFAAPTIVAGDFTKYTASGVYTIGGKDYTANSGWVSNHTGAITAASNVTNPPYLGSSVTAFLDSSGNIVAYFQNVYSNIVYVANFWIDHSTSVTQKTTLLHADIYDSKGAHKDYVIDQADSTLTTVPLDTNNFDYSAVNVQKSVLGPVVPNTDGLLGLYECAVNDDGTAILTNVNDGIPAGQFATGGQVTNFNAQNGDPLLNQFGGDPTKALYSNDLSLFFYVSGVYGQDSFSVVVKQGTANALLPVYAPGSNNGWYDIESYANQQTGANGTVAVTNNFLTAALFGAPAAAATGSSIYFYNASVAAAEKVQVAGKAPSWTLNLIDINTGAKVSVTTTTDPSTLVYTGAASPQDNFFVKLSGKTLSVYNTVGNFDVTSSAYRDRDVSGGLFNINKSTVEINAGYFASGAPMQSGRYGINANTVFVDLSGTGANPIQVMTGNAFRDYFRDGQLINFAVYVDGDTISGAGSTFAHANTIFVLSVGA